MIGSSRRLPSRLLRLGGALHDVQVKGPELKLNVLRFLCQKQPNGCAKEPGRAQQVRNFVWLREETQTELRCLIRDHDKKYTPCFDAVFLSEGMGIIATPYQAPNANAFAERWVRTSREECLDHILILSDAHLRRVLTEFVAYYNTRRPHQSLNQQSPVTRTLPLTAGPVAYRPVLGGIIKDYFRTQALLTA